MSGEGYRHEAGALAVTAGLLRNGATALDEASAGAPRAVDAGASSATVSAMVADVMRGMASAASNLDGAAAGVDVTSGAYGEVENTNAGELELKSTYGRGPGNYLPADPPMVQPQQPPPPQEPQEAGNGPAGEDGDAVGSLPRRSPTADPGPVSGPYDPGNGPGSYLNE